ncbi:hypothetical protein [Nonomuraea rubra]|uniref:Uncharacterized protein n=1 Tax=Nonomuraea rubra TaxID=46180 RepID=A0A7X0NXX8_9ACTN|nr:hypothetical protein [Nonomuraea rubra]MBB6551693.1 hypothetical protein [Nonomuraea rubra]
MRSQKAVLSAELAGSGREHAGERDQDADQADRQAVRRTWWAKTARRPSAGSARSRTGPRPPLRWADRLRGCGS